MSRRNRIKPDHAGAKNGGGYYGHRREAKDLSNTTRRRVQRDECRTERLKVQPAAVR